MIFPLSTSPGQVTLADGVGTPFVVFQGGASSVSNLTPFGISWGAKSTGVGWRVVTGANVAVVGFGDWT
jgi:hypothetical protein